MDLTAYLDRLAYRGPLEPTAATLRALPVAHLQQVPFENLDIHQRRLFGLIQNPEQGTSLPLIEERVNEFQIPFTSSHR